MNIEDHHRNLDTIDCLLPVQPPRGNQRQFSENICSKDDLSSRIVGKFNFFVVKFLVCLPLLEFFLP